MTSKERRLKNCKLYLVLDAEASDYASLLRVLRQAVGKGIDIVQLRDKKGTAQDILGFAGEAKKILKNRIPFIINDRVDIAIAARAQGVHLGQDDCSIAFARRMMGDKAIVGASCQNVFHARQAERDGADYIGFGSVFKTKTKPQRRPMDLKVLSRVVKEIRIPVFAIGGIDLSNAALVKKAGLDRVAVTRCIALSKNVARTTAQLKRFLAG